jgi:uncharacterized protein (DUF983 family)
MSKQDVAGFAALAFIVFAVVGTIWLNVEVWSECRQTNSFWYCVKLVSK